MENAGNVTEMYNKSWKNLFSWLSLSIAFLLITGCSNGYNSNEIFTSDFGHPENWANPAWIGISGYHSLPALSHNNRNLNDCRECHGTDLDGGISRISCYSCHVGPHGERGHQENWNDRDDPLHFHGYYGKRYTLSCSGCHGNTLSGHSGQSCFTCHAYKSTWNTFGARSSNLSGGAAKGPIITEAGIAIYELTDNFSKRIGSVLGKTTTDISNGSYSLDLGEYKGNALIKLSAGQYPDEATGNMISNDPDLRAVVSNIVGDRVAVVTPLTEIACRLALEYWEGLTEVNINEANSLVAQKLLGADIITTLPVFDGTTEGITQSRRDYGLLLGAISQMNLSFGYSMEETIYLLFDDLIEYGELSQATSSLLLSSLTDFLMNPANKTGIQDLSQTSLDEVWSGLITGPDGESLYKEQCAQCHGPGGSGLGDIPGIQGMSSDEAIGTHNWIQTDLTEDEIQAIAEFLNSSLLTLH